MEIRRSHALRRDGNHRRGRNLLRRGRDPDCAGCHFRRRPTAARDLLRRHDYDNSGVPNPTETNVGRFSATHYFFTKAGVNFPEIYCDLALEGRFPTLDRKINPLPDGLVWIRGMDVTPVLTTSQELAKLEANRAKGD